MTFISRLRPRLCVHVCALCCSLVKSASKASSKPIALVSFVDDERVWFKSVYDPTNGLGGGRQTPRNNFAFCHHAIQQVLVGVFDGMYCVPVTCLSCIFANATGSKWMQTFSEAVTQ